MNLSSTTFFPLTNSGPKTPRRPSSAGNSRVVRSPLLTSARSVGGRRIILQAGTVAPEPELSVRWWDALKIIPEKKMVQYVTGNGRISPVVAGVISQRTFRGPRKTATVDKEVESTAPDSRFAASQVRSAPTSARRSVAPLVVTRSSSTKTPPKPRETDQLTDLWPTQRETDPTSVAKHLRSCMMAACASVEASVSELSENWEACFTRQAPNGDDKEDEGETCKMASVCAGKRRVSESCGEELSAEEKCEMRQCLAIMVDDMTRCHQKADQFLAQAEHRFSIDEGLVRNMRTLTGLLPSGFIDRQSRELSKDAVAQTDASMQDSTPLHMVSGNGFIPHGANPLLLEELEPMILEIYLERIAFGLSRTFPPFETAVGSSNGSPEKSASSGNRRKRHLKHDPGKQTDEFMLHVMSEEQLTAFEEKKGHKCGAHMQMKLSGARNCAMMGHPYLADGPPCFREFVHAHFLKSGTRHLFPNFLNTVEKFRSVSPRCDLMHRLLLTSGDDYIARRTCHQLFTVLAYITRESALESENMKNVCRSVVRRADVLLEWEKYSIVAGECNHLALPWSIVMDGIAKALPFTRKSQVREFSKRTRNSDARSMVFRSWAHLMSTKRILDFDAVTLELVSMLEMLDEEKYASLQSVCRRILMHLRESSDDSSRMVEIPPDRLFKSLRALTGINAEQNFYQIYAKSLVFNSSSDQEGTLSLRIFAQHLLENNYDLSRMVAMRKIAPHMHEFLQRIKKRKAEESMIRQKRKTKKGFPRRKARINTAKSGSKKQLTGLTPRPPSA
eukprot:GEMP01004538.1.p1 GENE.GEMP01004538.1~~GEMP01004538.1.p1  ORF type:complete len:788 (+),score=155.38 GEMP01004538.1:115-2478(+)